MSAGASQLPLRSRPRRNGPEAALVDAALRSWRPPPGKPEPIVFREPELPTGCPDVVAVYRRQDAPVRQRSSVAAVHLQLLQHLHDSPGVRIAELAERVLATRRSVERWVATLLEAALVILVDDIVQPAPLHATFLAERILAIEAKINNWRDALDQAVGNTWFASHSYILLPMRRDYSRIAADARHRGIGVLLFDGEQTMCAVEPVEQCLPVSHGSWMFNEWISSGCVALPGATYSGATRVDE